MEQKTAKSNQPDPKELRKRKRERIAIAALSIIFIVLTIAEFRLTKVSSQLPFVNSIFFFGLININIILLIALFWLIFRNLGKLFVDRRNKIIGARLKTKLVTAFLALSIIPTLILFFISSLYINQSFDKWFSIKVQNTLDASLRITGTYYNNARRTAMHFAEHLASQLSQKIQPTSSTEQTFGWVEKNQWLQDYLSSQRDLLALDAVEFYLDPLSVRILSHPEEKGDIPNYYPRLALDVLDRAFGGEKVSVIHHVGSGDLIRSLVPVVHKDQTVLGIIAVNRFIPFSLTNEVDIISTVSEDYKKTNPLFYPLKTQYFVILVMITLVVIAVAIWLGLYLAKELTVPVERLVRAAKEIGSGNLDVSIDPIGRDEIATLVESFNKMTQDLKENRGHLTEATRDLEKRRLQLEAVLANVGTGVIVVDRMGEIKTFNRAATQLLEISNQEALDRNYKDILTGEKTPLIDVIERAFENSKSSKSTKSAPAEVIQWNFRGKDRTKSLAGIATSLADQAINWGVVVVIDDITHLIKSQREMAWREVARRIAHEIKNPLTPIKLSAQRLQRRLGHFAGREGALLKECTQTIVRHTDELKEMVNEFSNFARFPEASPAPHDLNEIVNEVVTLYHQAHAEIQFDKNLESRLPIFEFDRDQIKRAVMNLCDNAVAALKSFRKPSEKKICVETHFNAELEMAVLTIEDNGPGMTEEIKNQLFEPYFSTKKEGTGLGLAIAKRIVDDHHGFIRVTTGVGEGTRFLIELPTLIRNKKLEPRDAKESLSNIT